MEALYAQKMKSRLKYRITGRNCTTLELFARNLKELLSPDIVTDLKLLA